jgi:hypothetical protein
MSVASLGAMASSPTQSCDVSVTVAKAIPRIVVPGCSRRIDGRPREQRPFGRAPRLHVAGRGRSLAGVLKWTKVVVWFNVFIVGFFGFGTVAAVKGHVWGTVFLPWMGAWALVGLLAPLAEPDWPDF